MNNTKAYLQELADQLTEISVKVLLAESGDEERELLAQKTAYLREYNDLVDRHLNGGITITDEDLAKMKDAGDRLRAAENGQAVLFAVVKLVGILTSVTA